MGTRSRGGRRIAAFAAAAPIASAPTAADDGKPVDGREVHAGREVEESAMWTQIRLHESWGAAPPAALTGRWQGAELCEAYDR